MVQLRKRFKRNFGRNKSIISHGKLLDPSQLECEWDGKQLPEKLTTTEFLLVKELAKRPGIIKKEPRRISLTGKIQTLKIELLIVM